MRSLIEIQPPPGGGNGLYRHEPFGATIAFRRPEMVVLVDHDFVGRRQNRTPSGQRSAEPFIQPRAPFEAHLTIGHRCDQGCQGCYIDALPDGPEDLPLAEWRQVLAHLAELGVYHVALGAGESTPIQSFITLAHEARRLGMTPNLSTAGSGLTPSLAKELSVFGRVHLSLDGTAAAHERVRGHGGFESGLMSLRILRAFHPRVGVNCVVTRENFDELGSLLRLVKREGVRDVELLRFKPAGRGTRIFDRMDMTPIQYATFVDRVLGLGRRLHLHIRLDCSFAPLVCSAGIKPSRLLRAGLAGCVGGSWLVSVDGRGRLGACSFDTAATNLGWRDLGQTNIFADYTEWTRHAPEPCSSCEYLEICRGGCHVVARHLTGNFFAPDPSCPRVASMRAG